VFRHPVTATYQARPVRSPDAQVLAHPADRTVKAAEAARPRRRVDPEVETGRVALVIGRRASQRRGPRRGTAAQRRGTGKVPGAAIRRRRAPDRDSGCGAARADLPTAPATASGWWHGPTEAASAAPEAPHALRHPAPAGPEHCAISTPRRSRWTWTCEKLVVPTRAVRTSWSPSRCDGRRSVAQASAAGGTARRRRRAALSRRVRHQTCAVRPTGTPSKRPQE
jgi:hypothetical protein